MGEVDSSGVGGPPSSGTRPRNRSERRRALLDWRVALDRGHIGRRLSDDDIDRIADSPATTEAQISRLPVSDRQVVREIAAEIGELLTTGVRTEGPGTPAPSGAEPPPSASGGYVPDQGGVDPAAFAATDLSVEVRRDRLAAMATRVDPKGIRVAWPPHNPRRGVAVYRLVSGDQHAPATPELGDMVAASTTPEAVDGRPFASSVRYYQVWLNTGPNVQAALQSQPLLYSQGGVVAPVQDWSIYEDHGRVVGRWRAVAGTERVLVHRSRPGAAFSPTDEVPAQDACLAGFVDNDAVPGQTYTYSAFAMATVDGVRSQSAGVSTDITVRARLESVRDLEVHRYMDGRGRPVFDLEWTPPVTGTVRIHRTQEEPDAGLDLQERDLAALARTRLTDGSVVDYPTVQEDGRSKITGVPWPRDWTRAYFTPVTVIGERGQVGSVVTHSRTEPLRDAVLSERVDRQVVVFGWPEGAAKVAAYVSAPGMPLGDPLGQRPFGEISRDEYDRLGGLELRLLADPADVHLIPLAWNQGAVIVGEGITVTYPGLLRVRYELRAAVPRTTAMTRFAGRFQKPVPVSRVKDVVVTVDRDLTAAPGFTLVHNPQRMPLSESDGSVLGYVQAGRELRSAEPTALFEIDLFNAHGGFVRLFAQESDRQRVQIAVLDPDIEQLRA